MHNLVYLFLTVLMRDSKRQQKPTFDLGPLHMSPVDRAGSVTEMKFVSVHMVTFSPLCEMKIFEKVVTRPFMREI